jgi:hypothetical protein
MIQLNHAKQPGREMKDNAASGRWLMLIHQIPPKPNYLRVKIGRRLARIGAVALKNTVYVLPRTESTQEDFQWVRREVVAAGGEATLVSAHMVDGMSDEQVEGLFRAARDADYATVLDEARNIAQSLPAAGLDDDGLRQLQTDVARLERRMTEIAPIDFFAALSRQEAVKAVARLRTRASRKAAAPESSPGSLESFRNRTWVTRMDIHVDRVASAWLIRRFIDPAAEFKFVPSKGYKPAAGELRFDMYEAEFTHEGDQCTFEVLCERFATSRKGLKAIAEIIHDLDLKDARYGRPENAGVAAQIAGLALVHRDDEARVERGCELFDELLAFFSRSTT